MRISKHSRPSLHLAATAALVSSCLLAPQPAAAETRREYVNRFVLLIDWVTRAESWVNGHPEDSGLCRMARSIAKSHVALTQRMTPPPEFVSIHPHLLMVMENAELMFHYASQGNRNSVRRHRNKVHEEMRVMTELLQAEGHFMPVIDP